ncbi:MAG: aminopeptidase [Candidatus Aureabacteria bacterium]|nr:aminopeptidase [Candidatus Auribacterota bacterium]
MKSVFEKSLQLKDNESCLIVTDSNKRAIAEAFYSYAKQKVKDKARLLEIPVGSHHGEDPPSEVVVQMLLYDVELLITTFSLSHTTARRNASKNGIRIASMPDITEEIINRCLDIDYIALKKRCEKIHGILSRCSQVQVTTDLGTDMMFTRGTNSIYGQKGALLDEYGAFGNLPDGEVCFWPSWSEGVCFIDASMAGIGKLDKPLKVIVRDSQAVSITGKHAARLKALLDGIGPAAYAIAELGIGQNDKAVITGNILEDEKVMGTAHIAFGNNLSFGGKNDVPLHLDGVIKNARIFADGEEISTEGKKARKK